MFVFCWCNWQKEVFILSYKFQKSWYFICSIIFFSICLFGLQRFDEAANAFYEGVKLQPENQELVDSFR
jgi:hypothetical protein